MNYRTVKVDYYYHSPNFHYYHSIIQICRSGNRSKIIAKMMENKFDHTIYNAKYGIKSWIKEELITINPKKSE